MGVRKKKTAVQVLNRLLELTEYFNSITSNKCTDSDQDFMIRFGYANRKAVQRDLGRLEDMNYIEMTSSIATPVSIHEGSSKQFIRKYRTIRFNSSENGLLALPRKSQVGDVIGLGTYKGQDVVYEKEDLIGNSIWIIGPDHTLVRNKDK